MGRTAKWVGCAVLTVVLGASGSVVATQTAPQSSARAKLARFHVIPEANLALALGRNADGSMQVSGQAGELTFAKTVNEDGTFTLNLTTGRDTVTFDYQGPVVTVSRNGRQVVVSNADEDSAGRGAALLAGSRAVALLRAVSTAVQNSDDASAAGVALLSADALVGALTGDSGAPGRIAKHIVRKALSNLRRVEVSEESCYREWESAVLRAYDEFWDCYDDFSPYNPMQKLCSLRWMLEVEAEWFHMFACIGFSF